MINKNQNYTKPLKIFITPKPPKKSNLKNPQKKNQTIIKPNKYNY